MKHLNRVGASAAIALFFHFPAFAQYPAAKKDAAAAKTSHWDVAVSYLSNNTYLGRQDSAAVPYITPSIAFHHRSGLFVAAATSYLPVAGDSRIDVTSLEAGYSHETDQFNFELTAGRDFYSGASYAVNSGIKGRVSAYFSYDFDVVEPSVELGADFAETTDMGASLGIEHSFTIVENQLEVDPSIKANASSQNFYNSYFSTRRYSSKRGNRKNGGGTATTATTAATVSDASRFGIMDYEFSAPVEYTLRKKWKLGFTPTLAIPVNPSTVTVTTKTRTGTTSQTTAEDLSTVFTWKLGLSYTF